MRKNYILSEDIRRSPIKLPERRNLSVAPVMRQTRQREPTELQTPQVSKIIGEEKHKVPFRKTQYYIGPGNNGAIIRRVLSHRTNWIEHEDSKYMFINFRWQQTNRGYRYENCMESKVFKQVLNHFEFHSQLSNKEYLLSNLTEWCEHNKKNVFDLVPMTFVLNLSDGQFDNNLNNFLKFFEANLPLSMRSDSRKVWLSLKRRIGQHHSPQRKSIMFFCKPSTPEVFYSFNSNYLWLLKPTFLNRGRGIHVFNNLNNLEELMNSYITGKEEGADQADESTVKRKGPIVKSSSFIVQKYLEKPLLISGRKFDIRVWVLLSHQMKLYWFQQGYLRTSSEPYQTSRQSLDNLYIHLTNNAVQKNNRSYSKHEVGNQLAFKYLEDIMGKYGYSFEAMIKSMKQIIALTGSSVKKKINRLDRMNCFEIFGYDFMLDENAKLWLIEVNTNPCIEESSPLLGMLLPRMLDDAFKLTLDRMFPPAKEESRSRYPIPYHSSEDNLWQLLCDIRK